MFLKRLTAMVVALLLLVQFAACNQAVPDASTNVSQQTETTEIDTESTSTSNTQNTDDSHPDDGDNEVHNTTTSSNDNNGQDTSNSQQTANKDETQPDDKQEVDDSQTESNGTPAGCDHSAGDPYQGISSAEFYGNYTVACCNLDATYRSKHGLLSGSLDVPGQYAQESDHRPMADGKYVRNTAAIYLDDGNTYVVLDANGNEALRIHKAGGYITLEEVAAYMYAFGGNGSMPANYISKKSGKPNNSIWGEYLRVNHSYFIGDTDRYPYEPELPDISGCGGSLNYYEMDIGTTGTETPGYAAKPYVQGNKINRGAARLVYARQDLNGNGIYESNEVYVFYTHNHYNDFREYLNYYGGWGEMFGNVTGGGEYSSKTGANPTPYVQTTYADLSQ